MQARISKILKESLFDFTFSGTYTDMEDETHSYTLYTDAEFRQLVKQLFGARVYNDWDSESELSELITDFIASYSKWKSTRTAMYMGRLFALDQKFNPLENYNGYEHREGSFTHGESVELSFEDRKDTTKDDSYIEHSFTNYKETTKDDTYEERTYTNYEESMEYGQKTKSRSVSADDSTAYSPESQEIDNQYTDTKGITGSYKDQRGGVNGIEKTTTGSYKDQHGQTNNGITNEKEGTETTAHTGTDEEEYTLRKYGNLGVTTSQQMLESDLDLIRRDLVMDGIREFIDRFTYYSEEVDDGY